MGTMLGDFGIFGIFGFKITKGMQSAKCKTFVCLGIVLNGIVV